MSSSAKVLVTGASGLVGEGVLRRMLLDDTRLEAFVLVRDEPRWQLVSGRLGGLASRVVPLCGDVTLPGLGLDPVSRSRVERETRTIVHAAADTSFSRPLDQARFVNTLGTCHTAEMASRCLWLDRFVFVSTAFVAGRATGNILECDNGGDAGWVNSYEQSKYEAERIVRESGLPWTIVRPSAAGMSEDDAIVEGLARTGGLISSAAAIMIAVFAAFTLGDFVLIKILGFALSVAVLVDATVMRLAVGPALLKLGGRWNWWPGRTYARTVQGIGREVGVSPVFEKNY